MTWLLWVGLLAVVAVMVGMARRIDDLTVDVRALRERLDRARVGP